MFVAGKDAPTKITGDATHSHEFLIKPPVNASASRLEIFDAGLGGVADIVTSKHQMKTTYRLYISNAGHIGSLINTYEIGDETRFVNRWTEFDTSDPTQSPDGWILQVSAGGGKDVNSFKIRVGGGSSDTSGNRWSIFAFDLPMSLYGVSPDEEVQFRPAVDKVGEIPQLDRYR